MNEEVERIAGFQRCEDRFRQALVKSVQDGDSISEELWYYKRSGDGACFGSVLAVYCRKWGSVDIAGGYHGFATILAGQSGTSAEFVIGIDQGLASRTEYASHPDFQAGRKASRRLLTLVRELEAVKA